MLKHSLVGLIGKNKWGANIVAPLWLVLVICGSAIAPFRSAIAQSNIVPDNTLGSESSRVVSFDLFNLPVDVIDGGAIRGGNLFHSFAEFNVAESRTVSFFNPSNDIQNILARVTGNNRSEILGTLGIFNGIGVSSRPDLYLMNPNGILFGKEASLNVPGSFIATTANAIEIGEKGFFSATEPVKSNLLAVSPSALFFNAVNSQAEIANRSIPSRTVLENFLQGIFDPSTKLLRVPDGKSLFLIGGNLSLDGGFIAAPSGRVELGSVAGNGSVSINQTQTGLALGYDNINKFGDIKISNSAFISVDRGHIKIQANKLLAEEGSFISASTIGNQDGDGISIRTTESVIIDDALVETNVLQNATGKGGDIFIETKKLDVRGGTSTFNGRSFGGSIFAATLGEGKSGNIKIKAENISLQNAGEINASTFSSGDAGDIEINVSDSIEVIGTLSSNNGLLSKIASQVNRNATGKGGNLLINTKRLTVKDGAQIQAGTFSEFNTGAGGTLTVNATDSIEISGTNGDQSPSGLFTATNGGAETGDLTINTGKLNVFNGGTVSASTAGLLGDAKGGNLIINATDVVEVSGFAREEDSILFSSLFSETGRLLNVTTGLESAPGGNLVIDTSQLRINDGGQVSTATYLLAGNAGNLNVNAKESVEVIGNQSSLTAKTNGIGDAGNLTIRTQKLAIREGAEVSTSSSGDNPAFRIINIGQGGILDVDATDYIEVSGVDSGLVSFSALSTGDAGKIKLNTSRLSILDGATVSTSSIGRGKGGDLEITATDLLEIAGSGVSRIGNDTLANIVRRDRFTRASSLSSLAVSTKDAGNITINAGKVVMRDGGEISADTLDLGKGGNINIQANSASLENNAIISSRSGTEGSNSATRYGNAGDIVINLRDRLQSQNSNISTTAVRSSGGAINITAEDIGLFGDSDITTNVNQGTGGGGNITLTANSIIALDDSDILSFALDGKGGDITFNTAGFFSKPLYRPTSPTTDENAIAALDGNNRVDVNASGAVTGAITGIPDITFIEESLTDLPNNQIDPNVLIANSCIARTGNQNNTFFITGKGGIPIRPDDAPLPDYSTGTIRSLGTTNSRPRWKIGDPVVEPTGVYKLPNGKLVLSRECS